MAQYKLNVQRRDAHGKNQVDKLRDQGIVPGVIYHKEGENENVQVNGLEFRKTYLSAGTSALVDLNVEGENQTVLIKDVQIQPVKDQMLHVDFQEVRANEKLKVTIPVVLVGRDNIRVQPSILLQLLEEVEVECFPRDIPQTADVNVTEMQIGDVVTVADLDISKNDAIQILLPAEEPVASLSEPNKEEVEPAAEEMEEASAADVPEVGKEDKKEEEE